MNVPVWKWSSSQKEGICWDTLRAFLSSCRSCWWFPRTPCWCWTREHCRSSTGSPPTTFSGSPSRPSLVSFLYKRWHFHVLPCYIVWVGALGSRLRVQACFQLPLMASLKWKRELLCSRHKRLIAYLLRSHAPLSPKKLMGWRLRFLLCPLSVLIWFLSFCN